MQHTHMHIYTHLKTHWPLCATRPVPSPATATAEPKWRLSLSSVPGVRARIPYTHTHTHTHTEKCGWWSLDSLASVPPASALHPSSRQALPAPLPSTSFFHLLSFYLFLHLCILSSLWFPVSLPVILQSIYPPSSTHPSLHLFHLHL